VSSTTRASYDRVTLKSAVEIFAAADPPMRYARQVWYWLEFDGPKCERLAEYAPVLARAKALCAEHGVLLIDRSDKDSGYLRSSLGR
jgi:hypothetical protein